MSQRILLVEDEENLLEVVKLNLELEGYLVTTSSTGKDALVKASDPELDLILLDVMLPGMNGFDICQRIRQTPAWRHIKVVMLTAKGREVEITKGLALGADAYITKPFSTKALLAEVESQLSNLHAPLPS